MKVTLVAHTTIVVSPESIEDTPVGVDMDYSGAMFNDDSEIDLLHEFAGRACYKSFNRPNAMTAKNSDYLQHIIDSEHESVLEHGSATFYVEGVSRSLLLELERHGRNSHLSFSVESQRYVSTSKHHPDPVIPPLFASAHYGIIAESALRQHYTRSLELYDRTFTNLRDEGFGVKAAREASRAFLPNATPVDFVVTADLRGWRDVIRKRDADGADAEIREFAQCIAEELREVAPNSMQVRAA